MGSEWVVDGMDKTILDLTKHFPRCVNYVKVVIATIGLRRPRFSKGFLSYFWPLFSN